MRIRRLSGPEPIVSAGDVAGDHDAGDAAVEAVIAAVQASIDGPTGWLGRSLGVQELELTVGRFCRVIDLPYGPVTAIESVTYRDIDEVEQVVDRGSYRLVGQNQCRFGTGFALPSTECVSDAVTITYTAGQDAEDVPANAKQAVIIGVQHLKALTEQSVFLRADDVEGIGSDTYTVSEAGANVVKLATEGLLAPLRVFSL